MKVLKIARKLWALVLLIAILVGIAGNTGFSQQVAKTCRFVVIGDNRPPGSNIDPVPQPETFKENIREINLLEPDFVIIVGDLIRGHSEDTDLIIREWEDFDRTVADFRMPYYLVVGNHDVWNEESERIYQSRYGALFYSFDFQGSHFIVLDSDEAHATNYIRGAQLAWLKEDLENLTNADHIFVFLHKPLWKYEGSNWNVEVHPLLARHGVDAVFCGHWHEYRKSIAKDNVKYFITGGGGAEIGAPEGMGGFYHFMFVTVRDEQVQFAVVKTGGIRAEDIVTTELVKIGSTMRTSLIPRLTIAPAEKIDESFELAVINPFPELIEGEILWEIPSESHWEVKPSRCNFIVNRKDTTKIPFHFSGDAYRIFPTPKYRAKIFYKDEEFISVKSKLYIANDWYIRDWMVIGPFDLELRDPTYKETPAGFDKKYPPEREINLKKSYPGLRKKVSWFKCSAEDNGYVNLDKLFDPNDKVVAYALSYVNSPVDLNTCLSLGSDDGAKVWLNDKLIFSKHIPRGAEPDQDIIPVKLRKGWNKILVKVEDIGWDWGFYLRIANPMGKLKYRAGLER